MVHKIRTSKFLLVVFLTGLALLTLSTSLLAERYSPEIEDQALRISSQVMSPFCPGRMLRDCPSSGASELKATIRKLLSEGKNDSEVIAELYVLYGDDIKAVPDDNLLGRTAWLAPLFFVLTGFILIGLWLQLNFKPSAQAAHPAKKENDEMDPELKKRIESELKDK